MNIDFDNYFRTQVENALTTASWVEQVQQALGIQGVSQVWTARPQWYIWMRQAPGVYGLTFEAGEAVRWQARDYYLGLFTLKCYPFQNHPAFDTFSRQERQMVRSDLFDHTHTPRYEKIADIPSSAFNIAGLSMALDRSESTALLSLESLCTLRTKAQKAPGNGSANQKRDDQIIRNVPGFQIGYLFFDFLAGLWAHYRKKPPSFIAQTDADGYEHLIDVSLERVCQVNKTIRQMTATLAFANDPNQLASAVALWRSMLQPNEKIVFQQHLPTDHGSLFVDRDKPSAIASNSLWWQLAHTDFQSNLTSTCGCHGHQHANCQ